MICATLLKLALLTSNAYPASMKPDDALLVEALSAQQIEVQSVDWNSPEISWTDFNAVLIYSTWDYYEDPNKFLNLLGEIEGLGVKVYNPSKVVEWNSSKTYLQELKELQLNTIDTLYISSCDLNSIQSRLIEKGWDGCVIKPQVSANGHNTHRFNLASLDSVQVLFGNGEELLMVQPFAEEILLEGEWSFIFADNEFLHCILKKTPVDNFLVQSGEKIPVEPDLWMVEEAKRIFTTIQQKFATEGLELFHARIDVIRRDGKLFIMEVELIEPSLYLRYFPDSIRRIAEKIARKLRC